LQGLTGRPDLMNWKGQVGDRLSLSGVSAAVKTAQLRLLRSQAEMIKAQLAYVEKQIERLEAQTVTEEAGPETAEAETDEPTEGKRIVLA
jgi:hypothetical protein